MNDKTAAKQMRREYGENLCECCADCCNRQRINHDEPKMICIAYGRNLSWNSREVLCRERSMKSPVTEAESQIQLPLT